jgi:hypothetical protein
MDSPWVCGACYQVVSGRPSVTHSPAQLIATRMTTIPPSSHRRTDPPPVDIGAWRTIRAANRWPRRPAGSERIGIGWLIRICSQGECGSVRRRRWPLAVDVNAPSHRPVTGRPGRQLATNGAYLGNRRGGRCRARASPEPLIAIRANLACLATSGAVGCVDPIGGSGGRRSTADRSSLWCVGNRCRRAPKRRNLGRRHRFNPRTSVSHGA